MDDLKNKPIDIPVEEYLWALERPGVKREEAYSLPIVKNALSEEPLVRLTDFGIVNSSYESENYTIIDAQKLLGEDLHLDQHVFVRRSVAVSLVKIDLKLRNNGFFLFVRSGWRHPKVQNLAYFLEAAKNGIDSANYLYATPKHIISNPDATYPHSTGGVIDVEIWNVETNSRLPMGEKGVPIHAWDLEILFSSDKKHQALKRKLNLKAPDKWLAYMKNRRIIYHLFRDEGFYPTGEFWHWGRGDHLSAATAIMLGETDYHPWYRVCNCI
jgi:D-alanyl-D-alanine dipeptidase